MRMSVVLLAMMLSGSAFALDFYQDTVSSKLRTGRGYSSRSFQKQAQVSYAREGNRFVLIVSVGEPDSDFDDDLYFEFHGEIEKDGNDGERVKLYELSYGDRDDGGSGKCQPASDDCTLRFKWNIGGRSSAKGELVTEFSDDTVQLTFGITGYWFPDGRKKLDFSSTLQRSASASETCKLPSPGADLSAWLEGCATLARRNP